MIGWGDIYKVISAMAPLYVALILGYGSVKWWRLFNAYQCDVVNRLFCFIILPFFTFDFTAHTNPFKWNYKFIAADAISKVLIVVVIGIWAKWSSKGNYGWSITSYSLTLSNTIVIGMPLLKAMYGAMGVEIAVLSTIVQCMLWLIILMFVLECHRSWATSSAQVDGVQAIEEEAIEEGEKEDAVQTSTRPSFWSLMKVVWLRLAVNPNSYACIIGIVWAIIASRWDIELPSIIDKSVQIMSKAGSGIAMFSTGMFMAIQQNIIACGPRLTVFGLILKFIVGPAAMAIGAVAMGLRGDLLRIVIMQAALPQSITCFVYAKEYELHADVLSTAVIFGTVVSLPIIIAYQAVLDSVH